MARVKPVRKAADYPVVPDAETQAGLDRLFGTLFGGDPSREIDHGHSGLAVAAQSPDLALRLSQMSRFVALDLPWSQRKDLAELSIRRVNLHYGSAFSNAARLPAAQAGLSEAQVTAIADWRGSDLFGEEQQLVLEYTDAVLTASVDDELSARMAAKFGERGTVECAAAVGWWSLWAMLIEATKAGD